VLANNLGEHVPLNRLADRRSGDGRCPSNWAASQAAIDGVRVSRKRLLRLMREHGLLSPHRARTRSDAPHDRRIVTEAPNVMWATDASVPQQAA
jgi:HTH-like domain